MHSSALLLHLLLTAISVSVAGTPNPTPPPQLDNIIDALIGSGDFASWATILSDADPATLPFTATMFVPPDDVLTRLPTQPPRDFDPLILPYHVVPQRLTFAQLRSLPNNSRLPTLLPNCSILLTNASPLVLDGAAILRPDLYVTAFFAVHGVENILDYTLYGTSQPSLPPPPVTNVTGLTPVRPPPRRSPPPSIGLPAGAVVGGRIPADASKAVVLEPMIRVLGAVLILRCFTVHMLVE